MRRFELHRLHDDRARRQVECDLALGAPEQEGAHPGAQRGLGGRVLRALDRVAEAAHEAAIVAQQARHHEVHLRLEFAEVVLDRGAGHAQPLRRAQPASGAEALAGGVLEPLRLVEHQQTPFDLRQRFDIAQQQGIARDHEVELRQVGQRRAAIAAREHLHAQARQQARRLRRPVRGHRGWAHHQRRPLPAPGRALAGDVGQALHCLAQAHVVGQHAAEAVAPQEIEPGHPEALIRPQRGPEVGRRIQRCQALELAQLGEERRQPGAGREAPVRGRLEARQDRRRRADLVAASLEVFEQVEDRTQARGRQPHRPPGGQLHPQALDARPLRVPTQAQQHRQQVDALAVDDQPESRFEPAVNAGLEGEFRRTGIRAEDDREVVAGLEFDVERGPPCDQAFDPVAHGGGRVSRGRMRVARCPFWLGVDATEQRQESFIAQEGGAALLEVRSTRDQPHGVARAVTHVRIAIGGTDGGAVVAEAQRRGATVRKEIVGGAAVQRRQLDHGTQRFGCGRFHGQGRERRQRVRRQTRRQCTARAGLVLRPDRRQFGQQGAMFGRQHAHEAPDLRTVGRHVPGPGRTAGPRPCVQSRLQLLHARGVERPFELQGLVRAESQHRPIGFAPARRAASQHVGQHGFETWTDDLRRMTVDVDRPLAVERQQPRRVPGRHPAQPAQHRVVVEHQGAQSAQQAGLQGSADRRRHRQRARGRHVVEEVEQLLRSARSVGRSSGRGVGGLPAGPRVFDRRRRGHGVIRAQRRGDDGLSRPRRRRCRRLRCERDIRRHWRRRKVAGSNGLSRAGLGIEGEPGQRQRHDMLAVRDQRTGAVRFESPTPTRDRPVHLGLVALGALDPAFDVVRVVALDVRTPLARIGLALGQRPVEATGDVLEGQRRRLGRACERSRHRRCERRAGPPWR